MKKIVNISLSLLLATGIFIGCNSKYEDASSVVNSNNEIYATVKNFDGSNLTFDKTPEKIVVLSSATLEILEALGVNIDGTSSLATKPELKEKFGDAVDVGMATNPNIEKIASINPDLIIAGSTFANMIKDNLDSQGYKSWFVQNQSYDDVVNLIRDFGNVFNKQDKANQIINDYETRKKAIQEKYSNISDKRVAVIVGGGDDILLSTKSSYMGSLLNILNVKNIADNLNIQENSSTMPFSLETLVEQDPDYIFRIGHGPVADATKAFEEKLDKNPAYKKLSAVKNNKVFDLDYSIFFSNPGLKTVEGLEKLAEYFEN